MLIIFKTHIQKLGKDFIYLHSYISKFEFFKQQDTMYVEMFLP